MARASMRAGRITCQTVGVTTSSFEVAMAGHGPLRSDREFRLYWTSRAVSATGSAITTVVLPVAMFRITGSAVQTAGLTALEMLPYLVTGLWAGAVADRVAQLRLLLVCELLGIVISASVPVAAALNVLTIGQLYAVAACLSIRLAWSDAGAFGALPRLVGRDRLAAASASIASVDNAAWVAGPALGGVLVSSFGPSTAMAADAASYLLSGIVLTALASQARLAAPPGGLTSLRAGIAEGLRFVRSDPIVRTLTLLGFGNSFTFGAVSGLTVVFAVRRARPDRHR